MWDAVAVVIGVVCAGIAIVSWIKMAVLLDESRDRLKASPFMSGGQLRATVEAQRLAKKRMIRLILICSTAILGGIGALWLS